MAANDIANHFVRTYESNVLELVQQKYSKLRRTVTEKSPGPTEKHSFRVVDQRGAMTARTNVGLVAGKRPATPYADTVFNDRVCGSTPYGTADSYSRAEMLRMLEDPQSVMLQAQARQVGRQIDDLIIAAVLANATDTLATVYPFLAANQLGGAAVAPDFNLIRTVRETILEADVDEAEEVFLVVSPNYISNLLNDAKYGSVDYTNGRAVQAGGIVQGWMGFTWIMSNRLSHPVVGPPAQTYALAYTKDAIGLLVLSDVHVDVGPDPSKWFDVTCQTQIDMGATRIQDKKAWRVHYLETN